MKKNSLRLAMQSLFKSSHRRLGVALVVFLTTRVSSAQQDLNFAQIPITYSSMTHIAGSMGYFKDQQLVVRLSSVPAGPDVVNALKVAGPARADVGAIAITPVASMIAGGGDPVIIATTMVSQRQALLATFQSTGITANPASLRGKRIGVTKNTNGDIYLSRLLTKGKLTSADVKIVNGRPADLRNLLLKGELDAIVLWDPFIVQAKRQYEAQSQRSSRGRGAFKVFVDPTLHTLAFNIVTTKRALADKRPQLVAFLRALATADKMMNSNPRRAREMCEQWLGLERGDLRGLFATSTFKLHLNVNQTFHRLQAEGAWLAKRNGSGVVSGNLRSFIDASLLESIDRSLVKK